MGLAHAGHPEWGHTAGIETTTGPLGQGFANGVGLAIAQRFLADRWNRPQHEIVGNWIYAICSDGDLMEGVCQEAASIAGQLGLGRLVYVYDDNRITIDGSTTLSFDGEDKGKRFEAQGWHVQHVDDPNDLDALRAAFAAGRAETIAALADRPAHPHRVSGPERDRHVQGARRPARRGRGPRDQGDPGVRPRRDLRRRRTRFAPTWRASASAERQRGRTGRRRLPTGRQPTPTSPRERELDLAGAPREGWREALPVFPAGEDVATRDAGKKVMQALKPFTPTMIGGAADLVESTKTEFEGAGVFARSHVGRNIPFGIREHAMGAIVNGIALEPAMLSPYGSTFLIFSDYMRPSVRLSALMGLPSVWVWTHDSVAVGEDGPTHQPVEHLMSLRAIPNLWSCARPTRTRRRWPGGSRSSAPTARSRSRSAGRSFRRVDRNELGAVGGHAPRRLHALAARRRGARRDRRGDRVRGARGARGRAARRGERPRRLDAVLGAVREPGARLPRVGASGRCPLRVARGGDHLRLEPLGARPASASTTSAPLRRTSVSCEEFGITSDAVASALEARLS